MKLNITEPYLEHKLKEALSNGISVDKFIKMGLDAVETEKQKEKEKRFVAAINKGIEDIEAGRSRDFENAEELGRFLEKIGDEAVSRANPGRK